MNDLYMWQNFTVYYLQVLPQKLILLKGSSEKKKRLVFMFIIFLTEPRTKTSGT